MARQLDLRSACEAFVAVAERESFTAGARGAGVTQSVASRRVAALEDHLGARLFLRSSRHVELTEFGRAVLPNAIRLVTAAHALAEDAARARLLPVSLGVPESYDELAAARLAAGAAGEMTVEFVPASPAERRTALTTGRVQLALEPVEPDRASWSITLGVGSTAADASGTAFFLAALRPRRGAHGIRRLWLQIEDDVPNVRDRLERVRNGAGLAPGHLRIAPSLVGAMAAALSGDLALCTPAEAHAFGLTWHPLGDLHLVRGYALGHRDAHLAGKLRALAGPNLAAIVGATDALPMRDADPALEPSTPPSTRGRPRAN